MSSFGAFGLLALTSCLQSSSLVIAFLLLYYTSVQFPLLMAAIAFSVAFYVCRLVIFVFELPDPIWGQYGSKECLQLAIAGVCMGMALAADYASFRFLALPSVVLVKAMSPAILFLASLALSQQPLTVQNIIKNILMVAGVAIALHATSELDYNGISFQVVALVLDATWRCLLANCEKQNEQFAAASPLAAMANMAPFAIVTLLSLYIREEALAVNKLLIIWNVNENILLLILCCILAAAAQIAGLWSRRMDASMTIKSAAVMVPDIGLFVFCQFVLHQDVNLHQLCGYLVARFCQLVYTDADPLAVPYDPESTLPVCCTDTDDSLHIPCTFGSDDTDDCEAYAEILVASCGGLGLHTSCQLAAMASCTAKEHKVSEIATPPNRQPSNQ